MADDVAPVPVKRTARGQFAKGASGNEGGKKPGTRNRATVLAQSLLDGEAEEVTRALIREAKAGQPMALKLAVERLLPLRRGAPIAINIPAVLTAADAIGALKVVMDHLAEGHLSPEEAAELASLVDAGRRVVETADLETRVIELEAVHHGRS